MSRLLAVILGGALVACTSALQVRNVTSVQPGDELDGVPFRVKAGYTVRVWMKQPPDEDGNIAYKQVFVKGLELADPTTLYSVGFTSTGFTTKLLEVKLHDDGTLDTVHLKADDKTADVVSAAGKQVNAAGDALASFQQSVQAAQLAQVKSQSDLATAQQTLAAAKGQPDTDRNANLVAALQAANAAEAAERALEGLPNDATAATRADAAAAVRLARLQANVAYQKAGLASPYPGTFP